MKIKLLIITLLFFITANAFADEITTSSVNSASSVLAPQTISYDYCTKIYKLRHEELFELVLCAISASRYKIEEIQTTNGYIIFKAANGNYLATIAKVDNANSVLKITPCNNIYVFPPAVILNLYKYIELNTKEA